jgi:uncharacterized phage protein (TIGR01671 family)
MNNLGLREMDDFKFRGWNPMTEKMEYWSMLDLIYGEAKPDLCIIKWMQWIGINDKNGVKIFEGDVVRITKQSQWFVGLIGYETRWTRYVAKVTESNRGNKHVAINNTSQTTKVIGNIYENPELLK